MMKIYRKRIIITKLILKSGLLIALCAFLFSCKKDDGTREVTFTTDRPCEVDNSSDNISSGQCTAGPTKIIVNKGDRIRYTVYSNCSGIPKKEAHLVITVKIGRKTEEIYNSNSLYHQIDKVID